MNRKEKRIIYADNAATTRLDQDAFEAMRPFLCDNFGNASQQYSFSRVPKNALKIARETIASCINASPEEIFFTSGGTESDNWALKGILKTNESQTVITSQIEHHAILHTCASIEQVGNKVIYLPVDRDGIVDTNTLQEVMVNKVALVSVMYANNEIGSLEPIQELCNIAHRNGAKFHTDAVQAVGHVKIDVKEIGVDMMSASAHKFNGPKGIGFLYVKAGTALKPFADGGAQEYGMRAGTENVAGIVAMSVALKKACSHIDDRRKHLLKLEDVLLQGLKKYNIDFVRNGSSNRVPGNISLSFKNANGEMLLHRLDLMGIMVSTGSACDSTNTQMSHVLKAIKIPKEYGFGTIRISFNHENTEDDAKYIAESIGKILTTVVNAKLKRS